MIFNNPRLTLVYTVPEHFHKVLDCCGRFSRDVSFNIRLHDDGTTYNAVRGQT